MTNKKTQTAISQKFSDKFFTDVIVLITAPQLHCNYLT
jgi:hypothetical protein